MEPITLDLNGDAGESTSENRIGDDSSLFPYITSVNIACGFHAGNPDVMRETVALAMKNNLAIGAHPSFPDLAGFGRREMHLSQSEIYDLILYQVGALHAVVRAAGGKLHHVKPHGALYNMAAKDKSMAGAIVSAIFDFDKNLILYGLSGSELIHASQEKGLRAAEEAFADRTYADDGSLTPRTNKNALIDDIDESVRQVLMMMNEKNVATAGGKIIPMHLDTLCIHGDGRRAVELAKALKEKLIENNVVIRAFL